MHLKPNALGLAGAFVTAVGYVLCSAAYALWPAATMKFSSLTSHNFDFTPIAGSGLTWGSFFAGLVAWVVLTYLALALLAWFYNQMHKA